MINEQTTENKQLQTNLAIEVLEQFLNLKARISVGIIYLDLQRFLGDIKVAIDKFERSSDSEVCPYLTELIKKIMFYHEFAFQCMEPTALLSSNNSMGKIVAIYFPDMARSIVHGFYDKKVVIASCFKEAEKLTNELYRILNDSIDLTTLDVRKITRLPNQRKQPKYNASSDKIIVSILGICLGAFGVHKLLLGYRKEGLIMLGISLLTFGYGIGFMSIVGIIEGLIYLSKSNQDFARIYVAGTRGWF
jgi:TM2 domain-containing membrane protein YozV